MTRSAHTSRNGPQPAGVASEGERLVAALRAEGDRYRTMRSKRPRPDKPLTESGRARIEQAETDRLAVRAMLTEWYEDVKAGGGERNATKSST